MKRNKKITSVGPISFILIWSLGLYFIPAIWCSQPFGEVVPEDLNNSNDGMPPFDWPHSLPSSDVENSDDDSTSSPTLENSEEMEFNNAHSLKKKRALFGILRLVTQRPHKTDAELHHNPPQGDSFISMRGKKNFPFPFQLPYPLLPFKRGWSLVVPVPMSDEE